MIIVKTPTPIMNLSGIWRTPANLDKTDRTPLRIFNYYEIELHIKDGGSAVIDGKEYPICKGSLLFSKPLQSRQSVAPLECYFVRMSFEEEDFEEFTQKYLSHIPTKMIIFDVRQFIDIFETIIQADIAKPEGSELLIQAKLLELISCTYHAATSQITKTNAQYSEYQFAVYQSKQFINNHFSEHLTLNQIAASANLSPSYFHKVFKALMGITPYQYHMNIRLNKAKELLLHSEEDLFRIAEICGFESQSYFNYVFKKELNISPRSYRINNRNNFIF